MDGARWLAAVPPTQPLGEQMDNDAYLEHWSAWQIASGSTDKSIRERVIIIRSMLRRTCRTALTVTRHDVIRDLGRPKIQASTRAHYKSVMYAFFTWMQEEEFRLDNPAVKLPKVRVPKSEPNPVTTEEIEHLLHSGIYGRTRLYVLLYAYQGFRAAEIAAVSGSSIDWKRLRILSVDGKAGKEVWRPIHPIVARELEKWRTPGWLFPSPYRPGEHVSANNVSNVLSQALKRAGINHRPHQMRAWFATELIDAGVSTLVVAEAMRHSGLQTVEKYVRVKPEAVDEAQRLLPVVRVPDRTIRRLPARDSRQVA